MEHQFHAWLKNQAPSATSANNVSIIHGIGDDAAVINFADQPLIVTTDAIAEGTHFWLPKRDSDLGPSAWQRLSELDERL